MRLVLLGAAALALVSTAALAADADPMANLYGNTLVVVDKGGMESHTMYGADHTFSGIVPSMGYKYGGTWAVDDKGQLCRTFNPAVPGRTNPDCDPMMAPHAVGDKWDIPGGGTVTLTQGADTPAAPVSTTPASN